MSNLESSIPSKGRRLRIYIGESDRWRGEALEMALLRKIREQGIAGATVFRGVSGFGAHSLIHTTRFEVLSTDLPVVIESIDTPERIQRIIEVIYPMVREGLITVEDVEIVKYTHRYLHPLPADKLVSEVMTREVVTLSPGMLVLQAWKTMLQEKVKAAPVIDQDGKVIGILTDEDLLQRAGIQQRLSVAIRLDPAEINQEFRSLENIRLKVSDVMTQPVVTVLDTDALETALKRIVDNDVIRLPVVDNEGKLVGLISRLDILRQVADTTSETVVPQVSSGVGRKVADIMRIDVPMVNQYDDLSTIIEKFLRTESYRLIVVDAAGKAIGLISDSDVVARVQPAKRKGIIEALRNIRKPPPGKETALELMSPGLLMVKPETPIIEALRIMLKAGRKWMVVADENNRPLGLLDRQLMLEALANETNQEAC